MTAERLQSKENVELEATNLANSLKVELLRSNNFVLQQKLQPRRISQEKINNFIFLTKKIQKIPVSIGVGNMTDEAYNYATQFRTMFNLAGFQIPQSEATFPDGVRSNPARVIFENKIAATNDWSDVLVIFHDQITNFNRVQWSVEFTNGFPRPTVSKNEADSEYKTCNSIAFILNQMGIKCEYWSNSELSPDWPNPCLLEIFIRQKSH